MDGHLLQLVPGHAEGHSLLDEGSQGVREGPEVGAPARVDRVADLGHEALKVVRFPVVDSLLRPRQELRSEMHVRSEAFVRIRTGAELGQGDLDPLRILLLPEVLEDVRDHLLVLDRLEESPVADRLLRVREDELRACGREPAVPRRLHLAFRDLHEVRRGVRETEREALRDILRLLELPGDVVVPFVREGALRSGERRVRGHDGDVRAAEVRDDLLERSELRLRGVPRRPFGLHLLLFAVRKGELDLPLRGAGCGATRRPALSPCSMGGRLTQTPAARSRRRAPCTTPAAPLRLPSSGASSGRRLR